MIPAPAVERRAVVNVRLSKLPVAIRPSFIAEIKTRSPFGYQSPETWATLFEYAFHYGQGISVHTDPRFGGSFEEIALVRALTSKFILAKGFHHSDDDIKKALNAGATRVLVVGRIPHDYLLPHCWVEPYDLARLRDIPSNATAVWNARDLKTGLPKKETWAEARQIFQGQLCQASRIKEPKDVAPDAEYFIVGEHLTTFSPQWRQSSLV